MEIHNQTVPAYDIAVTVIGAKAAGCHRGQQKRLLDKPTAEKLAK